MNWNQRYAHEEPFGNITSIKPECVYCYNDNPEQLESYGKGAWGCVNHKACAERSAQY
jgi:hypothetical protein